MRRMKLPGLVAFVLACGCAGEASYRYNASVTATVSTPDLVTVSPGVQVIADYDEPIFYSDGFYWRYYDGGWYRSSFYTGGWVFIDTPPITITRIDRPYVYRRYHPAGYVVRHRPVPVQQLQTPVVRDRRADNRVEPHPAPGYVAPENRNAPPGQQPNKHDRDRDKDRDRGRDKDRDRGRDKDRDDRDHHEDG